MDELTPSRRVAALDAYRVPKPDIPTDLYLAGNEGPAPDLDLAAVLGQAGPELLRSYPSRAGLEQALGERFGVGPERVIATAGADDALDRICRAVLEDGRELVLPEPTFSMFHHYATLAGGRVRSVGWDGPRWPVDAVCEAVDARTAMVALVSPNNPTGAVVTADDLARVAAAAPHALIVVDHAYVEFADAALDLTRQALELPNAVVMRTLSKAWGMAGARVGCALGPERVIGWLGAAGGPYMVSGPSIALALARLADDDAALGPYVDRVRQERDHLEARLARWGGRVTPSQGNFVFARFERARWIHHALCGMGIMARAFPGDPLLDDALRITCPGNADDFDRLDHALETIFEPEALLFDMDGVLADVSHSYREAIRHTARSFGVELSLEDISQAKAAGDANNDWVLTRRLLAERGVEASLEAVTDRFEAAYQGSARAPGLWRTEELLCTRALLDRLGERYRMAIVTGRPRHDAERFVETMGIDDLFEAMVCMEDAPAKPDPAPVHMLLDALGVEHAWLIGDTPDDARAARAARVLPIGVLAAVDDAGVLGPAMRRAGAARILDSLDQLEELLP